MTEEQRDQLLGVINQQLSSLTQRQLQIAARLDAMQDIHVTLATGIEHLNSTTVTLSAYEHDEGETQQALRKLREDVDKLLAQPSIISGLMRIIVPAIAIFVAMLLASFGLNLTTLIFVLQHVSAGR